MIKCSCSLEKFRTEMKIEDLKKFYNWFKNLNNETQELVLDNFIEKLSKIPITTKNKNTDFPF